MNINQKSISSNDREEQIADLKRGGNSTNGTKRSECRNETFF